MVNKYPQSDFSYQNLVITEDPLHINHNQDISLFYLFLISISFALAFI